MPRMRKMRGFFFQDGLVCLVAVAFFLARARAGLMMPGFVDESAAFLGGWVVDRGGVLYRDFVDDHGPLQFMLTAAYGAVAGWHYPAGARVIPVALVLLAAASVAASPMLRTTWGRASGSALFLGVVAAAWTPQGLYFVDYYSISGALAVIALALFALPAACGLAGDTRLAFLGGVAAALLGFSAYSYMPTAASIAAAGLWTGVRLRAARHAWWFIAGGAAGSLAVVLWLAAFGDLRGYLAFHIAFGQAAYRPFIDFGPAKFLRSLIPSSRPERVVQSLAVCASAVSVVVLVRLCAQTRPRCCSACLPASFLVTAGVLALNLRGEVNFQDGTFVIAAAGLLSLVLSRLAETNPRADSVVGQAVVCAALRGIVVAATLAAHQAAASPFDAIVAEMRQRKLPFPPPEREAVRAARIRTIVRPGERFLALAYRPEMYLEADRLPIEGYYAWFPWDAAYARSPWFGRPRDICVSLPREIPPVIFFEADEDVWGRWPKDYMPCVERILAQSYRALPDDPELYVRLDRVGEVQ